MSSLDVAVRVDTAELSKLAVAKAQFADLSAEIRKMAREVATSGQQATTDQMAALDALVTKQASAGASMRTLSDQIRGAAEVGSAQFGRLTIESTRFAHELTSGEMYRAPGTLIRLVGTLGEISPVALVAAAGVAALAGGVGLLAADWIKVSVATHDALGAMVVAGTAGAGAEAKIEGWIARQKEWWGTSTSEATATARALAKLHGNVASYADEILNASNALAKTTNTSPSAAVTEMVEAFNKGSGAALEYATNLGFLTTDQERLVRDFTAGKDEGAAFDAVLAGAAQQFGPFAEQLREYSAAVKEYTRLSVMGETGGVTPFAPPMAPKFTSGAPTADPLSNVKTTIDSIIGSESQRLAIQHQIAQITAAMPALTEADAAKAKAAVADLRAELANIHSPAETAEKEATDQWTAEAQKELQQQVRDEDQANQQKVAAARDSAETQIAISHMRLAAERDDLTVSVAANESSIAQKYSALRQLAQDETALDMRKVVDEFNASRQTVVDQTKFNDEILKLAVALNLQLAKLGKEQVDEQTKQVKELARAWQQAFEPVESFMKSAMATMLEGGKNMGQKLEEDFGRLSASFVEDIAVMMAKYGAFEALGGTGGGAFAQALNPFGAGATGLAKLVGAGLGIGGIGKSGGDVGSAIGPADVAMMTALGVNTTALGVQTGATATQSAATAANTGGLIPTVAAWIANTVATAANTVAVSADAGSGLFADVTGSLGIAAFAEGASMITHGGLAIVHGGESIVPAESAGAFTMRDFGLPQFGDNGVPSGGIADALSAATAGDIHFNGPINVNLPSGTSFASPAQAAVAIGRALPIALRNSNSDIRNALATVR